MSDEYRCETKDVDGFLCPAVIWQGTTPLILPNQGEDDELYLDMSNDEVAFLLRVLNAHDGLVAACKAVRAIVEILPNTLGDVSPLIDAALAKAEGQL